MKRLPGNRGVRKKTQDIMQCLVFCVVVMLCYSGSVRATNADDKQPPNDSAGLVRLLRAAHFEQLERKTSSLDVAYLKDSKALRAYDDAMRAFQTTDETVAARLNEWVKRFPDSYGARLARSNYFIERGWQVRGKKYVDQTPPENITAMNAWFDKALADLRKARSLSKKPMLSYLYEMQIVMARGSDNENRALLRQATALDPGEVMVYRAYMLSLRPQWGGSIEQMNAFLDEARRAPLEKEDLRYLEAKIWRARARQSKLDKDYRAAIEHYTRAIALFEEDETYGNRGDLHARLNQHDKAIQDFGRALELKPLNHWALLRRGTSRKELGDIDGALADLDEVLRVNPESVTAYAQRAHCHLKRKDYTQATADLGKAAKGKDSWALRTLGDMHWDGVGMPADKQAAVRYWKDAAVAGDRPARERLANHTDAVAP